jgi:hypothetical protein
MPNANAAMNESHPSGDPGERRRRVVRAAGVVVGLGAVAFVLGSAHVPCGFARMFHMPCPGCGSTRAMLALLDGDLHALLHYNPLAPFMTALVVVLAVQAVVSVLATGTFRDVGHGRVGTFVSRGMMIVATLEVLVWIARFGGFLGGPVPV